MSYPPNATCRRSFTSVPFLLVGLSCLFVIGMPLPRLAAQSQIKQAPPRPAITVIPPGDAYRQTNFVSDSPGAGFIQDPLLVNPWGITLTATSPFWVANNGTSTSTLYRGDVSGSPLAKNSSLPSITIPGGWPTGTVANSTTDFVITSGSASGPARFLFASITGNITGWNPNVPAAGSTQAIIAAPHPGHVYTGLAIGNNGLANFLYAADFANGTIDTFNSSFALQSSATFPFVDPLIPAGYHPFNITNIGGTLYVAYAKVGSDGESENGPGFGYVSTFDTNGAFLGRLISNGALDAPWGMTIAPASFGTFSGALLVGNFSDEGRINAYNPTTGAFLGALQNEAGDPIEIDELWALVFGNGGNGGDPGTLYFSAGIGEEEHGLFGSLKPTTASATSLIQFASNDVAIGEGGGHVNITVTRAGDVSGAATVNYATFDESQAGHASQKSDYEISLGQISFNAGETSKTFRVLIVDDEFVEGEEQVGLILSNPAGAGVGLGTQNTATLRIIDNDSAPGTSNAIDVASFFVRQHFLDFLNREPDTSTFNFLVNQITACGGEADCTSARRVNVSTAFFLSNEFQVTGFAVYLANKAAFGAPPLYGQFMRDVHAITEGVAVGEAGWEEEIAANKKLFFADFVLRPQFVADYPTTLTPEDFVDALFANAGVTASAEERQTVIDEFGAAADTADQAARARALQDVAENSAFAQAEFNRAFVLMEFFGYLRRDPDTATYNFWLNKLDASNGDFRGAELIKGFLDAPEYRQRFGANVAPTPTPTPTPSPTPSQSLNISTRARVQTGDNVMIGGFIVTGAAPKKVIVRAIGPSLQQSGVTDVLADPVLELHGPTGTLINTNDNWKDTQQAEIEASGIPPTNDLESAIVATLPPAAYTAIVKGKDNTSGIGLAEIYDLDSGADSQLGNISTRAFVDTQNNVVIGGFILGANNNPATILIRAIAPSLADEGIAHPLADPTLELHNANGTLVTTNDNWRDSQQLEILASGIAPKNDLESSIIANLTPGSYTAIVSGAGGKTGLALVEIYNLQ